MATQNHNTQTTADRLREAEANLDRADNDDSIFWALEKLGDMLWVSGHDAGLEGIRNQHLSAVGIAIRHMAGSLRTKHDKELQRLENIAGELYDQHEKEQKRQRRLHSEMDEKELSQVASFLKRFNAGELTMDNIKNIREICPELEPETAGKLLAILEDDKTSDSQELSVVS